MLRSFRVLAAGRVLAGLSQQELADAAKLAVRVIHNIEAGTTDPKYSTLVAIVDALRARGVRVLPEDDRHLGGVALERPPRVASPDPDDAG